MNPIYELNAFNCPHCNAYSEQIWSNISKLNNNEGIYSQIKNFKISECRRCRKISIWENENMIYPIKNIVELPNEDMPDEVKIDYIEASKIVNDSPRGAAALIRLAIQKLCIHLGEKGEHLDTDIKSLLSKGLSQQLHKAFEIVRIIGNNAVHPGEIRIDDDKATAIKLFSIINIICTEMISRQKLISDLFDEKMPPKVKKKFE